MCPSAFRVSINMFSISIIFYSKPPRPTGEGEESNLHENLFWTGGDVSGKFHQDRCRGLDFHKPSTYTNRQTNKQTSERSFLYI